MPAENFVTSNGQVTNAVYGFTSMLLSTLEQQQPTHIAVALQYNPLLAPAPIVVAMGADNMAQKIKEIARENGVPIRENKPLARALYKDADIGQMIPEALFQAVATMLAQLDKFRNRGPR